MARVGRTRLCANDWQDLCVMRQSRSHVRTTDTKLDDVRSDEMLLDGIVEANRLSEDVNDEP
jgi:hypothetical protein